MKKNGTGTKRIYRENIFYFLASVIVYAALSIIAVNATLVFAGFSFVNPIVPAIVSLAAFAVSGAAAKNFRNKFLFLFALCFCLLTSGLFFFFFFGPRHEMTSGVLWPILVILCGLSFLFASILKKRKITGFYSVIALAFIALGSCFFLFSSNVIPISLATVFLCIFIPFLLIFTAVAATCLNNRMERQDAEAASLNAQSAIEPPSSFGAEEGEEKES